jgi:hypothetical protein
MKSAKNAINAVTAKDSGIFKEFVADMYRRPNPYFAPNNSA